MRDFLDRKTIDLIEGQTLMMFQVNYKYVHTNGKIRSGAEAVDAIDEKTARKNALEKLKKEHDHVEITSIKQW